MKMTFSKLTLGLAVASLTSLPALAGGDWYGGIKDMRGTHIPVPAPVPAPEYKSKWYFRFDFGAGYSNPPSPSENGMRFGNSNAPGPNLAGNNAQPFGYGGSDADGGGFFSTFSDDGNDFSSLYSLGVGMYASKNTRWDITGEFRSRRLVRFGGSYRFRQFAVNGDQADANPDAGLYEPVRTGTAPNIVNSQVNGSMSDETRIRSMLLMGNYYYDMKPWFGLRPYLGAGIGISYNEMDRRNVRSEFTCDIADTGALGGGPGACTANSTAATVTRSEDKQYSAAIAASVHAGVSQKISDITHVDLSYRYLFVGGTENSLSLGGNSVVDYGNQHEHYIRAGLRFDIH